MAQKNVVIGSTTYSGVDKIKVKDTGNNDVFFTETSDSNAVASEIENGKTAYVNGTKITGTHTDKLLTYKNIDTNGTYNAIDDNVDGYDTVTVSVQATVNNQDKTFVSNGEYTADSGYTGLGTVTVNVPSSINNQNKTVTPTTSQQTVNADNGYSGLGTVTVNAVTSAIDNNITAGNIKKNVKILGVTGTLETGITPTGNINITDTNSTDVTNYATAQVVDSNLSAGNIKKDVSILGVTGTYEGGSVEPAKGVIFYDYNANGYPTKVKIKNISSADKIFQRTLYANSFGKDIKDVYIEGVTSIGAFFESDNTLSHRLHLPATGLTTIADYSFNNSKPYTKEGETDTFEIPASVTTIMNNAFAVMDATKKFVFLGQCPNLPANAFKSTYTEEYDFTNCTSVPTIANTNSLVHKANCVFRIPASLATTWMSADVWSTFADIVWKDENDNTLTPSV